MGSKRKNIDLPRGSILNAKTGEKTIIPEGQDFIIGRSTSCSLTVAQSYVSCRQCIIKVKKDEFIFYSLDVGTYLNCEEIPKGKKNSVLLKHGDLICFGREGNYESIFQFCLSSNAFKKSKSDTNNRNAISEASNWKNEHIRILTNLRGSILYIKMEKRLLEEKIKAFIYEFNGLLNTFPEKGNGFTSSMIDTANLYKTIDNLTVKLNRQEELLNGKSQQLLIDNFKILVFTILKNNCMCSICNEVVIKVLITNCFHSFCEKCIVQWIERNKHCPICRTSVNETVNCYSMDDLISNIYKLIGGDIEKQRTNLINERKPVPKSIPIGRSSRLAVEPLTAEPEELVEIIDLTDN